MNFVSPDKACVHSFDRSIEFCGCGKVRSNEMSREVKVIKKADREQQNVVPGDQKGAILSGDEFIQRQWRALVRLVKEMEDHYGFRFNSDN